MGRTRATKVLSLFGVAALAAGRASAQCEGEWLPGSVSPGIGDSVYAVADWDPDGPGPRSSVVAAGGEFLVAGDEYVQYFGAWEGEHWQGYCPFPIAAMTMWDPDEDGPELPRLVVAGQIPASPVRGEIMWRDGTAWRTLGSGVSGGVGSTVLGIRALATWDPDGAGPLRRQLIAGGNFTTAGGLSASCIARWDGSAWHALGSGVNNVVHALTTWDPDGTGPQRELLVAGGAFSVAGGQLAARIAAWDGSAWRVLGTGMSGPGQTAVFSLTTWDPDGAGPLWKVVVAGGSFTSAGSLSARRIAAWNGSSWSALGDGMDGPVNALAVRGGVGEDAGRLVAGGAFMSAGGVAARRLAAWDGGAWSEFGGGTDGVVRAVVQRGGSSGGADLIVAGDFLSAGDVGVNRIAAWTGAAWRSFGRSVDKTVRAMARWDEDGDGPGGAELVVGGDFFSADGARVRCIGAWNGSRWRAVGGGMDGSVSALTLWDPDGDGPAGAELIAGGRFTTAGGVAANRIASWNGVAWRSLGGGMNQDVLALTSWDIDGAGPLPPRLAAGGRFTTAGGVTVNGVAWWDGHEWHALGAGLGAPFGGPGSSYSLCTWDPDDEGPAPNELVVGGGFTLAGGAPLNGLARYDGARWLGVGISEGLVRAMTRWDPDGPGPIRARLAVAGGVSSPTLGARVAAWDGATWTAMEPAFLGTLQSIGVWTDRATGAERLVIGGDEPVFVAVWNGAAWSGLAGGVVRLEGDEVVAAIGTFAGAGSESDELIIGGRFARVDGAPAAHLARWSDEPRPWVAVNPESRSSAAGAETMLSCTPASGYARRPGGVMYQWRRNGVVIVDGLGGASAGGGVVSGSSGVLTEDGPVVLSIAGVQAGDAGSYDCVISNSCGSAVSDAAALTVAGGECLVDLSGDGVVDFGDYLEFLNLYEALDPRVDFNQDGVIDFGDYLEFLNLFDAGC